MKDKSIPGPTRQSRVDDIWDISQARVYMHVQRCQSGLKSGGRGSGVKQFSVYPGKFPHDFLVIDKKFLFIHSKVPTLRPLLYDPILPYDHSTTPTTPLRLPHDPQPKIWRVASPNPQDWPYVHVCVSFPVCWSWQRSWLRWCPGAPSTSRNFYGCWADTIHLSSTH